MPAFPASRGSEGDNSVDPAGDDALPHLGICGVALRRAADGKGVAMLGVDPTLNQGSYQLVKARANDIYRMVSFGAMAPGHPGPRTRWQSSSSGGTKRLRSNPHRG